MLVIAEPISRISIVKMDIIHSRVKLLRIIENFFVNRHCVIFTVKVKISVHL